MNLVVSIILPLVSIFLVSSGIQYGISLVNQEQPEVKGVTVNNIVATLTPTPSPLITKQPQVNNLVVTQEQKQYGGWYWREELGRAERWMGKDSEGKDLWAIGYEPTATPTPAIVPIRSISESYGSNSSSYGVNESIRSYGVYTKTKVSEEKKSIE